MRGGSSFRGSSRCRLTLMLSLVAGVAMSAAFASAQVTTPNTKTATMSSIFAESGSKPPLLDGNNAATVYLAAWDSLTPDQRAVMGNRDDERHASALLEQQAYVEKLMLAASLDKCDWGLNYQQGLELLLPHLGQMRSSARTLISDANRLLALEGTEQQRADNKRDAVRRVKATLAMSMHLRSDRILISGLVSAAINNLACTWIDERLQAGTLSTDNAQQLLSAMRSLDRDDMFGLRASVEGEWDIFDLWFKNKFAGEDAAKQLAEAIPALSDGNPAPADAVISAMNRKELDAAIARMHDFYMDVGNVWNEPDARERIAKLSAAATAGEYGAVAQRLAPSLDKARASDNQARATYQNTMKLLQAYINNNGALPADLTPPAADVR